MRFDIKNKKGSMAVETAIFLPVFLIGLLMLLYLIRALWIEERIFYTFESDARRVARFAYAGQASEHLGSLQEISENTFEAILKGKIYSEHSGDIKKVQFTEYKYLFTKNGLSGLISAKLHYDLDVNLPLNFYNKIPIEDGLLFRGFIGADSRYPSMPFEEMRRENESKPVWIFPRAGERYHKHSCTYISNQPRQMSLTGSVKNKYSPCHICDPQSIKNGGTVYCFTKTGEVYHRGSCPSVDKYVVELDQKEAETKGYTSCMKCGGA